MIKRKNLTSFIILRRLADSDKYKYNTCKANALNITYRTVPTSSRQYQILNSPSVHKQKQTVPALSRI